MYTLVGLPQVRWLKTRQKSAILESSHKQTIWCEDGCKIWRHNFESNYKNKICNNSSTRAYISLVFTLCIQVHVTLIKNNNGALLYLINDVTEHRVARWRPAASVERALISAGQLALSKYRSHQRHFIAFLIHSMFPFLKETYFFFTQDKLINGLMKIQNFSDFDIVTKTSEELKQDRKPTEIWKSIPQN